MSSTSVCRPRSHQALYVQFLLTERAIGIAAMMLRWFFKSQYYGDNGIERCPTGSQTVNTCAQCELILVIPKRKHKFDVKPGVM